MLFIDGKGRTTVKVFNKCIDKSTCAWQGLPRAMEKSFFLL